MNPSLKFLASLWSMLPSLLIVQPASSAEFSWPACTLAAFTNSVRTERCTSHTIDNGETQVHMFMLDRSVVSMETDREGHIAAIAIVADFTGEEIDRWLCQNFIRETIAFLFPEWDVTSAIDLYTETLPNLLPCAGGSSIKTRFRNRAITITPSEYEGGHPILSLSPGPST